MTTILTDDTVYTGTDGDDSVTVLANNVTASGSLGDDWLTASLLLSVAEAATISTTLRGNEGSDRLQATLGYISGDEARTTTALLDGGAGADELWLSLVDKSSNQFATLTGGDGDDVIRATAQTAYVGEFTTARHVEINVDGGAGRDSITIDISQDGLGAFKNPGSFSVAHGGAGDDLISSKADSGYEAASNILFGDAGNDTITGVAHTSYMFGGLAANEAHGGAGNDTITLSGESFYRNQAQAWGDEGNDTITLTALRGATSNTTAWGGDGDDLISATSRIHSEYDGTLFGAKGTVELHGGAGNDRIGATVDVAQYSYLDPDAGNANCSIKLYGDEGNDRMLATLRLGEGTVNDGRIEMSGGAGNDVMSVRGGGDNILSGDQGDDTLAGGGAADRLIGGQGADRLAGYGGADEFVFLAPSGSDLSERDVIADFHRGEDLIDVSGIDANPLLTGNQSFQFSASPGVGRLWVEDDAGSSNSILHADTGAAVLVVTVADGRGVHAADYTADDFLL